MTKFRFSQIRRRSLISQRGILRNLFANYAAPYQLTLSLMQIVVIVFAALVLLQVYRREQSALSPSVERRLKWKSWASIWRVNLIQSQSVVTKKTATKFTRLIKLWATERNAALKRYLVSTVVATDCFTKDWMRCWRTWQTTAQKLK